MTCEIVYAVEMDLSPAEFIDVLVRSTLGERRPIHDAEAISNMLRHASLIVTARLVDNGKQGKLVGVSRALTDFGYCTYLSDLAVDEAFQKQGIGKKLIQLTHEKAGLNTSLILLAAPKAREYYPKIGMQNHDSCWYTPRISNR